MGEKDGFTLLEAWDLYGKLQQDLALAISLCGFDVIFVTGHGRC